MQYQDIRDSDGVPWRDKTGSHRTFASKLEEGGSDSSIDTVVMAQSAAGANDSQCGKLQCKGKVTCRTTALSDDQIGPDERECYKRECYKCVHIDVENLDGTPGEFLSFPPYSAPGGLQEIIFPEQYQKSCTSARQDSTIANSSSELSEMVQVDDSSSSSLNGVLESSVKTFRRLGLVAGASLLRFGDLSVYEEAHFSAGGELNDCADLTHLGGCGCFEEQKRLYQLRLEALETTKGQASGNVARSDSASTFTTNRDKAQRNKSGKLVEK